MWKLTLYRGKWTAVSQSDGKTIRRSLRTSDKSLADSRFEDFLQQQKKPNIFVHEIFQNYMKEKNDPNLLYRWKVLEPHFTNLRPDQINKDTCKKYIAHRLDNGKRLATIITELSLLRAALRFENKNTAAEFYIPSQPEPRNRHLTRNEAKQLIDSAIAPHIKLYIIIGLTTAARKSAILQLKWSQIDFERGIIDFGKGNKNKSKPVIPINMTLERALEVAYQYRTTDYVIENSSNSVKDIKRGFKAAVKRSGLIDVRPHDLRHTAAVWMAEDRKLMSEIAQYLGHTNSKVTERVYARYSPDYLRTTASALELEGVQLNGGERHTQREN